MAPPKSAARCIRLRDKGTIERFLRRNTYLHLYGLGDLDPAFWPFTVWYGLKGEGQLRAVVLVYTGLSHPTVLALGDGEPSLLRELLQSAAPALPKSFHAHLSPSLSPVLAKDHVLTALGEQYKMALKNRAPLKAIDGEEVIAFSPADAGELTRFYDESYPGHWFEPSILKTGQYFGIRRDRTIVCAAGVHVYSPSFKVAALGNIATRPDCRGQGLARAVTAALCRNLMKEIDSIGLNVKADNHAAIACYRKLGFEIVADFEEFSATAR